MIELDIDGKKQIKKFSSKILKMDENSQYGMAMTKPLPYGCIKKQDKVPTLTEFNKILDSLSPDDNIGNLFTVDIKFHNINEKTLFLNELYPPIFEKNKKFGPFERSTSQLLSVAVRNEEKNTLNSFPYDSKTHSILKEKKFILLYAEDLHFLITRASWLVNHIYEDYTFEQSKFKKDFVIMSQNQGKQQQAMSKKISISSYTIAISV